MTFNKGQTSRRRKNLNKSIVFNLSEDTKNRLEKLAERRQISQGALCRYAITEFIERNIQNEATRQTTNSA